MFSFGIIAENFEAFENDIFYCNVSLLVSSFCDVCSAVSKTISWVPRLPVSTVESGWLRFLKNWHISSQLLKSVFRAVDERTNLANSYENLLVCCVRW